MPRIGRGTGLGSWGAVAAGIAGSELLARSPLHLRAPSLLLVPLILFVAYRHGLRAGLLAALTVAAYLAGFLARFGGPLATPDADRWGLGILAVGILLSTALIGHLRDRFDRLLKRERSARERADGILASISDAFVALDHDWRLTYLNPAAQRMFVPLLPRRGTLLGLDVRQELPRFPTSRFYTGIRRAFAEGVPVQVEEYAEELGVWLEMRAHPSGDGVSVLLRDVSERRHFQEKLRSLSMVDELTGLYNRRGFFTLAGQHCKQAVRKKRRLLLVFADLDNLKRINDRHGHPAGDRALLATSEVLRHTFRDTDIVARIGGDEFAALALEIEPGAASILLERMEARLAETNAGASLPFHLSVSVGTAVFEPGDPCTVEELVARADRAMYSHKRQGKSGE